MTRKFMTLIMMSALTFGLFGCKTGFSPDTRDEVFLPFMKNSPNECYYLDEFMPTPDGMVTGKHGSLSLRYYTYKTASYKEWGMEEIMLSFYSRDDRCWSLFEEYYIAK